jgi:uncharacterized membrane protein
VIDVVSVVVGAIIGAVFMASVYEVIIRKRMKRLISIMARAQKVDADIADLGRRIEDLKNKKGGKEK